MGDVKFVIVVSTVSDGAGGSVAGPVQGITAAYLAALRSRLSQYWSDVSGARVQLTWAPDATVTLTETFAAWSGLTVSQKLAAARSRAEVPDGTNVMLIANDATPGSASAPAGAGCYVHATWLSPSVVAHELGHFFEYAGSGLGGHADVARTFFRDEYGDPTCIMGGEDNKLGFSDALVPALTNRPRSTRSGPLMNPALVDQCGWLDVGSALVPTLDRTALGSVTLQTWTGAPPAGGAGTPRAVVVEGVGPEESRLYVCVRQASGWDRGSRTADAIVGPYPPGSPTYWVCAYLSTSSGDSLLLARRLAVEETSISLHRVPIRIRVGRVTREGVTLELSRSSWRGSAPIEGVECDPHAQVAVAAWGTTADMYVIDRDGHVRYNHFNGDGWEHRPWPLIDGVECDPRGGIAAVARREGLVDVFVVDTDRVVRRRQRHDRAWSPAWQEVAGGGLDSTSSLAAAWIDESTLLLCGVRSTDRQVSRTLIDQDGVPDDWTSAPDLATHRVAATSGDDRDGRIYATAVDNVDQTVWVTPDVDSGDPAGWGLVGRLTFDSARPITASRLFGADDFVVAGIDPLTVLFWTGTEWQSEQLNDVSREPEGGISCFSMEKESFQAAYVDADGVVNVLAWSPRQDFVPATNQYESESTVAFQVATGHFIQAKNGGGDGMGADSANLGAWEKLRMLECETYVINAGGTRRVVTFQTHDGHYVGAIGGGGSHLVATATKVGPWERFYIHDLGYSRVTVGCIDEAHFWSADGGGGHAMAADKTSEKEWETFTMVVVAP